MLVTETWRENGAERGWCRVEKSIPGSAVFTRRPRRGALSLRFRARASQLRTFLSARTYVCVYVCVCVSAFCTRCTKRVEQSRVEWSLSPTSEFFIRRLQAEIELYAKSNDKDVNVRKRDITWNSM